MVPRCNFPYAGVVNGGSLSNVRSNGYYWSRTVFSSNSQAAHLLTFNSYGVLPAYSNPRYDGFPIRCVATT